MEPSTIKFKSNTQAKPISELLPSLTGILSEDAVLALTAKKQPRRTLAQPHTSEKEFKPLTIAEMRADISVLNPQSSMKANKTEYSVKKKGWNSSVKVDKKINHTANGQLKNNPVRKALNFQSKPRILPNPRMTMQISETLKFQPKPRNLTNPRMTMQTTETPKFPKPETRAKKSLYPLEAKNSVRISGICNIPPTPVENKPLIPRHRKIIANKENNPNPANSIKKIMDTKQPGGPNYNMIANKKIESSSKIFLIPPTPKHKKIPSPITDTPLSNSSWKSGSDASFLQKEKEICEVEEKVNAIFQEQTLENIAEISPPVSTPFKEYRSVQEYFNNSSYLENSAVYNDNTIMSFDKPSVCKENYKREESVIVSLCDLFNKATVTNTVKALTEIDNLLEVEQQTENNIKMLENGIKMLNNIKESHKKSLQHVRKLIQEKKNTKKISESDTDKTLVAENKDTEIKTFSPEKSPILSRPSSVIKSLKSPNYKIPRKSLCLRKKVVCKSMPNVSITVRTPVKHFEGRALNMYMKMKEQNMNFLSTPMVNRQEEIPDTPALTSHNLQKQLNKLYGS